jgi:1-deoxy-D-xylulose-5-phosphate reductoisomerase
VFQVFENHNRAKIDKIILTASGGPFLNWTAEEMERASPAQALKHPNWVMGPKISIDSATMMNKALEVIEAHYLFNLPPEKIEVVIHPQSIVHAMVAYQDGSVLSQMGPSDMRVPIAHALGWPDRIESKVTPLDLTQHRDLTFLRPDLTKFKALEYAYKALAAGPEACIALNAANEVAVSNFLENSIGFGDIIRCVGHVLENTIRHGKKEQIKSVEQIERCDTIARASANEYIKELQTTPKRKVQ